MTIAVDLGRKATKTNKQTNKAINCSGMNWLDFYDRSSVISSDR